MNLDDILNEWSTDCEIGHRLDDASAETPKLHAKYLGYLTQAKFLLKRTEDKQRHLLKNKHLYYNGKMSQQEIDGFGWSHDPFDGLKMMQKDLEYWYESDKDIQQHLLKNFGRLDTFTKIRDEVLEFDRAKTYLQSQTRPMELGGFPKGGKGKKGADKDIVCDY